MRDEGETRVDIIRVFFPYFPIDFFFFLFLLKYENARILNVKPIKKYFTKLYHTFAFNSKEKVFFLIFFLKQKENFPSMAVTWIKNVLRFKILYFPLFLYYYYFVW